jgi:hypothetical protein
MKQSLTMKQTTAASVTRRRFLAASCTATLTAPHVITAAKGSDSSVVGEGAHRFQVNHQWAQLPDRFQWQTTHNVAIDRNQNLYVIHEGDATRKEHPAIFVFDESGRYVRSFGKQFQGGGHGIEVREEEGEEYLYVCAYQHLKTFAKLSLTGEVVWQKHAPIKAGGYAQGEASNPQKVWGRDRFMPTNFAFLPDGDFLLADGYGSWRIHRYDRDGNWKYTFGGPGEKPGQFNLPHGIWFDERPGRDPLVVIADRAHHTLQYVTLEGNHVETLSGFGLPANLDTHGELLLVPELYARVSLLDKDNQVVARLGDDVQRIRNDNNFAIRRDEKRWQAGRFIHPHDACFDQAGNIFVAEWVASGRITRLQRLS